MGRKAAPLVLLLVLLLVLAACGRKGDPYPRRMGLSVPLPAVFLKGHG